MIDGLDPLMPYISWREHCRAVEKPSSPIMTHFEHKLAVTARTCLAFLSKLTPKLADEGYVFILQHRTLNRVTLIDRHCRL